MTAHEPTIDIVDVSDDIVVIEAPDKAADTVTKKTLGLGFWLAIGWIVLICLLAIFADVLPLKDPDTSYTEIGEVENIITGNVTETEIPGPFAPSGDHWFGRDQLSRDVLSRTIYGARISLVVGFVAIALGMVVGGFSGMVAGFFGGKIDAVISFIYLVLLSFPALVLAILITALVDRSLFTIAVTLGVLGIAPVGRLARAATLVFAEREFVMAARTIGAKRSRILMRELLPNVMIPMSALALLGMAVAIVAEGGLAFLGLSVEKGQTWGKLILNGAGTEVLQDAPYVAFTPIGFLFLTVMSLNFAGDRLRDYFDVREISL